MRDPNHLRCIYKPLRPAEMDGFVVYRCARCGRTAVKAGVMPPYVQVRLEGLETAGQAARSNRGGRSKR